MSSKIVSLEERRAAFHNVAVRGYQPVFRDDQVNHCPGCGRSQWYVGRSLAECAFCATALPIVLAARKVAP